MSVNLTISVLFENNNLLTFPAFVAFMLGICVGIKTRSVTRWLEYYVNIGLIALKHAKVGSKFAKYYMNLENGQKL